MPRAMNEQRFWAPERGVKILEVLWMVRTNGP